MARSETTTRQQQVLDMADQGLTSAQIAEDLQISYHTVVQYKARAHVQKGQLSNRQRQIAEMVARGLSTTLIAAELGISKRTVDSHRATAHRKLETTTPAHLSTRLSDEKIAQLYDRISALEELVARQDEELARLRART